MDTFYSERTATSQGSCGTMLVLQDRTIDFCTPAGGPWGPGVVIGRWVGGVDLHTLLALTPFGPLCGRSGVGAEMANENHGSPREEASLLSHSPGTSNQSQPCSPKPIRLVQDLPGTGEGQWQGGGVGRLPQKQP